MDNMHNGFDIFVAARGGFLALDAHPSVDKDQRGDVTSMGVIAYPEKNPGAGDYQMKTPSDPANTIFWKSSKSGNLAPRGSARSWTFAMPVIKTKDGWMPLESTIPVVKIDKDFEPRKDISVFGGGPVPNGTIAHVVSTTGHKQKNLVAIVSGGTGAPLIAQHRGNNIHTYSTHVFDIEGDDISKLRHAGLHTIWKVIGWDTTLIPSKYATKPTEKYQIALMGTGAANDKMTGYLPVTFSNAEGTFSQEAAGPFSPCSVKHEFRTSFDGRPIRAGGLHLDSYFHNETEKYDAPLDFELDKHPKCQESIHPYQVHLMMDEEMKHPFITPGPLGSSIDLKKGKWRWHVKIPVVETPPCKADKTTQIDSNGNALQNVVNSKTLSMGGYMAPSLTFISQPGLLSGAPRL